MLPELTPEEIRRYSRHLLIPEIGMEGQRRLKAASALIVGVGGLGSAAALYLAAAGVGRIGLVDGDVVDESNLQRQVIHDTKAVGRPKVDSARLRLRDLNPAIRVDAYNEPFTSASALRIAENYEVVVDCSDNLPTRRLTNAVCIRLDKPNIYGAVFCFEGQMSVFFAREGPCYQCVFPVLPPPGSMPSSAESGVLAMLPGVIGTLQATEAVKILLGVGSPLIGRMLVYNALEMSFEHIKLKKNPKCAICDSE